MAKDAGSSRYQDHARGDSTVGPEDKSDIAFLLLLLKEYASCVKEWPDEEGTPGEFELAAPAGQFMPVLSFPRKPAMDEEENRNRSIAGALVEEIALDVKAGDIYDMFAETLLLGAVLRGIADCPVIAANLKRLRNKRAAADEARTQNAQRARELLAAEKKAAGQYFDRAQAIKAVAKKMDVHPKTVGRWLKNSRGQH
jgi:hypothetical protein